MIIYILEKRDLIACSIKKLNDYLKDAGGPKEVITAVKDFVEYLKSEKMKGFEVHLKKDERTIVIYQITKEKSKKREITEIRWDNMKTGSAALRRNINDLKKKIQLAAFSDTLEIKKIIATLSKKNRDQEALFMLNSSL